MRALAVALLMMASILCWITGTARIYCASKRPRLKTIKFIFDIFLIASLYASSVVWALEAFHILPNDPNTITLIIPPLIVIVLAVLEDTIELQP